MIVKIRNIHKIYEMFNDADDEEQSVALSRYELYTIVMAFPAIPSSSR